MKASVIYFSDTGNTKKAAEIIAKGMASVEGVEVKAISLDDLDQAWIAESSCVIVGSPTYMANMSSKVKAWLEGPSMECGVAGNKLAGAFATANFIHGGGDMAVQTILTHMMVAGMMAYSGGAVFGEPVIHVGPIAIAGKVDEAADTLTVYGERMAAKAVELFG